MIDLDLDHNLFDHELSYLLDLFQDFVYLEEISLNHNNIYGEIPSSIGSFENLTKLRLNNLYLTGGIPSSIGNLTNLIYLNLNVNQLTGIIPMEICNQGDSTPNVDNNQFCPPYPICDFSSQYPYYDIYPITSESEQDISNCY